MSNDKRQSKTTARCGSLSIAAALVGLVAIVIANFEVGWIARIVSPPYGVQFAVNVISGTSSSPPSCSDGLDGGVDPG
jgi:hypothetical protein